MKRTINEKINYISLIKVLNKVCKKISHLLDTPVNFAILFGEGAWEEILITIEYTGLDHDFNTSVDAKDLYEVFTEYGEEKFVDGMVKTIMDDSMKDFLYYISHTH